MGQGTELCPMAVCIWYQTATTDFLLSSRVKMSNYSLSHRTKKGGKKKPFLTAEFFHVERPLLFLSWEWGGGREDKEETRETEVWGEMQVRTVVVISCPLSGIS